MCLGHEFFTMGGNVLIEAPGPRRATLGRDVGVIITATNIDSVSHK